MRELPLAAPSFDSATGAFLSPQRGRDPYLSPQPVASLGKRDGPQPSLGRRRFRLFARCSDCPVRWCASGVRPTLY